MSEWIYKSSDSSNNNIIEEYGSTQKVRFLDPEFIKMYDCDGKEVEIPKCKSCGVHKLCAIGKDCEAWINQCECKFEPPKD